MLELGEQAGEDAGVVGEVEEGAAEGHAGGIRAGDEEHAALGCEGVAAEGRETCVGVASGVEEVEHVVAGGGGGCVGSVFLAGYASRDAGGDEVVECYDRWGAECF